MIANTIYKGIFTEITINEKIIKQEGPSGIVYWITKTFNHEKSLMFKYGRMQKKILVCGSHGACLDCMLPGVQVTAGLGFFLCSSHLCDNEDCDSLL